jgi:hypothetical protein
MHTRRLADDSFSGWRQSWSLPVGASILGSGLLAAPRFLPPERTVVLLTSLGVALVAVALLSLTWKLWAFVNASPSQKRNRAIAALYSELRPLMARQDRSPDLEERIRLRLARLQELQMEEAEEIRRQFETVWKPGEGLKALEDARRILAEYEDPSATDFSSLHHG